MENFNLTIEEKLENDSKALENGLVPVKRTQCEICKYNIEENSEKCEKYKEDKPLFVIYAEKECSKFEHKKPLEIKINTKLEEKLYGSVFGFAVADAIGVPVEFSNRRERNIDPVKEMRAYGTHYQYFGTWSDDSSLTFCLMDSLKNKYDIKDIASKFCEYYFEGYLTPYKKVFDVGNTTRISIQKIESGFGPLESGEKGEFDNGNGSLMRVMPLCFYLKDKKEKEKIKIIEEVSSLTHLHKRSKLACIIYVEYLINLLKGETKKGAYTKMQEFVFYNLKSNYEGEFKNFKRILKEDISTLDEIEIKSSGYVIDTLEASLWAFMLTDNYKDAVLKAINLGEDTDTVGSITGSLAGIYYGIQNIPKNWLDCLSRKEDILKLTKEFSESL